jgi:hypothetical protein
MEHPAAKDKTAMSRAERSSGERVAAMKMELAVRICQVEDFGLFMNLI